MRGGVGVCTLHRVIEASQIGKKKAPRKRRERKDYPRNPYRGQGVLQGKPLGYGTKAHALLSYAAFRKVDPHSNEWFTTGEFRAFSNMRHTPKKANDLVFNLANYGSLERRKTQKPMKNNPLEYRITQAGMARLYATAKVHRAERERAERRLARQGKPIDSDLDELI